MRSMARRRHRNSDDDAFPGLPIPYAPVSNGEYTARPLGPVEREVVRRTLVQADENAARAGVSRRQFLLSVCGAATMLAVMSACADESNDAAPGGSFDVPPDAGVDRDAALAAIGGGDFVFDVQTHFLQYDLSTPFDETTFGIGFPQAKACPGTDPRACLGIASLLGEVFVRSDTNMMIISGLPLTIEPNPASAALIVAAREAADRVCGDGRVRIMSQVNPTEGDPAVALAAMTEAKDRYDIVAWKTYTHAPGAWRLDDADGSLPQVGAAMIEHARKLGIPIVNVHKGLSDNDPAASPADVGPAARDHPDVDFVVFHSGYESGVREGPYDPAAPNGGIDRLIASLQAAGLGPGSNVYAELGSTWYSVMRDPTQAAHTLGKLMRFLGEDNVVWGTDTLWYGSPQGMIQALRAFTISSEFQERFGYPELTDERKAKIFGANAAVLYGIVPDLSRCDVDQGDLDSMRSSLPVANVVYGPDPSGRMAPGWLPF